MARQKQRILDLKARMPHTEANWGEHRETVLAEIAEIESMIQTAKDELGNRTAAGRAKG
jgi:hypothetical protein